MSLALDTTPEDQKDSQQKLTMTSPSNHAEHAEALSYASSSAVWRCRQSGLYGPHISLDMQKLSGLNTSKDS